MPKVSIIVPCYRVERQLDRCLQTLLNQSLKDIEIILVDDGSPDNVPEMCDIYAAGDSRVSVIHKQNEGLGFARNSGLEIATGEYVAFVDSDDYVSTNMYACLYSEAVRTNADAVFCGFNKEVSSGVWEISKEIVQPTVWRGDAVKDFMLDMVASSISEPEERRYYMAVWRAIYRTDLIRNHHILFLSERAVASEDIPFQVDFLLNASCVSYIPVNAYYYCLNGTSLTATFIPNKYDRFRYLYSLIIDKTKDISDGRIRADRFFIGYCRTQIHHAVRSKSPNALQHIKYIVNDPVWNWFRSNFPTSNFCRVDLKLMYWLILHKHTHLLYLNSLAVNGLRYLMSKAKHLMR